MDKKLEILKILNEHKDDFVGMTDVIVEDELEVDAQVISDLFTIFSFNQGDSAIYSMLPLSSRQW